MDIGFIEMLLLVIGFYLVFMVVKLNERIKGIRYTLDLISKKVDIPENPINDELRELINDGDDIKAVKKARETLGLSLVEGKQYVDALKLKMK
ncbi:hypothetical protein [Sporosarcina ureae]|uniref:hypothetical protein n=1 Tax=Sporosarcina ureae TaxID=1571 RepID=UPI0009DC56FF|nr:hypothetical protein [Sporosarcina ureae]ARF18685.1 hypothetical protein SporoP17a_16140 [Sporosarcina ureae]